MVIIHNLDDDYAYIAVSSKQAKNKMDYSGIEEALKTKDTVVIGRTTYEFSRPLQYFAETQGRQWKRVLREAWLNGNYPVKTPNVDIPYLQRLRNKHGNFL